MINTVNGKHTIDKLEKQVRETYPMFKDLPPIKITYNHRLKAICGKFMWYYKRGPKGEKLFDYGEIHLNPVEFYLHGHKATFETLAHEFLHYWEVMQSVRITGVPYSSDDSMLFIYFCDKLNIPRFGAALEPVDLKKAKKFIEDWEIENIPVE
jgi:hypothetical protein